MRYLIAIIFAIIGAGAGDEIPLRASGKLGCAAAQIRELGRRREH